MVWHCAISEPQAEEKAAKALEAIGVTVYLPMCLRDLKYYKGKKSLEQQLRKNPEVPLLSRYFLFNPNDNHIRKILSAKHISGIVKRETGEPIPVSQAEYSRWVQITAGLQDFREKSARYILGQQLTIERGPMQGWTGILRQIMGSKLQIEVASLGGSVKLVANQSDVRSAIGA